MKLNRLFILSALFCSLALYNCNSSDSDPVNPIVDPKDTTGNGGGGGNPETGTNLNPDFSIVFNGTKVEFSKVQADYGSKTYLTCFDKSDNFVLDLAIPVAKGLTCTDKQFNIVNDQYTGLGMFIDPDDKKWFFSDGKINVTKNAANTISGTFSAKAYLIDYSEPTKPVKTDSCNVTNGVFNNLKVKG